MTYNFKIFFIMVYMITLEKIFVQAIKDGQKIIEVRTRIPKNLSEGDVILIAQKASHGRVVLHCKVNHILEMHPDKLYTNFRYQIHCPFSYYRQYTHGRDKVFGIVLTCVSVLPVQITTQMFLLERAPQWFNIIPSAIYNYVMTKYVL